MTKIKVNDKCTCGSNLKYKKCCMLKHYINENNINNQNNEYNHNNDKNTNYKTNTNANDDDIWRFSEVPSSTILESSIELIQKEFNDRVIINITNSLNKSNYETYQIKNYYTNIIMIAEKSLNNSDVFVNRSNSELSNLIVMYHGSYRTFSYNNLMNYTNNIIESINQMG